MKKRPTNHLQFPQIIGLTLLTVLSSCVKRDLDYRSEEEDPEIRIDLDWNGGYVPSGVRFHFYHEKGSVRIVDCPAEGFKGQLAEGTYRILAYNTDAIGVEHTSLGHYEEAFIRALPEGTSPEGAPLCHVSNVYCVAINHLTVAHAPQQHTVIPQRAEKIISFRYRIEQADDIKALKSTLTGVVPAIYHHTGSSTGEPCRSIESEISMDGSHYTSQVRVLGLERDNFISVEITHRDGSTEQTPPQDIGRELDEYVEGKPIEIVLKTDRDQLITIEVAVEDWRDGGQWWLDIENQNTNILTH